MIACLDKLAASEHPDLAPWARLRRNEPLPGYAPVVPLPRHAQDTLAALCGFERHQLLEILSTA
ncbi:hypothetical protein ACFXPA_45105 [Amycolatopsis sp. NPDC059090]|uniref:hypothetical protein n=1 Tax=Amycolatopsis sp. NPDC059090 TaxID=3346723 RepID=UPI00366F2B8D